MSTLSIQNLQYCYQAYPILNQINMQCGSGDCLLLTGGNGSGKTTLLHILAGIKRHYSGDVQLDGVTPNSDSYRQNMVFVGHHNGMRSAMTVSQMLHATAAIAGISVGVDLDKHLVDLGLDPKQTTQSLSAGQARKLALCRLKIIPAKLWLLDEPFTNIDQAFSDQLGQIISQHCERGGITILSSHHELAKPLQSRGCKTLHFGEPVSVT